MVGEVREYDELAGIYEKLDTVRIPTSETQQDFLGGQNHFSIKPENVHFWCFTKFHKPFATVSQPHRPPPHNFSPGFWMFHRYHLAGRPISKATIQK